MKILFLAHRTPYPPNKGEKIRSYHILSALAEKHEVSLAYWVDDPRDDEHRPLLAQICRRAVVPVTLSPLGAKLRGLAALGSGRSFSEGYFYSRQFQLEVDCLFKREQFDLVYVFGSPMAQYVKRFSHLPIFVDFVDVDSDKWGQFARFTRFPLSLFFLAEKKRLAQYEIAIPRWARLNLFVSQSEAKLFKALGGQGWTAVLPNGVNCDLLRLSGKPTSATGNVLQKAKPSKVVFIGTLSYFPNYDAVLYFAHEIFPLVRKDYPGATFDIVGRSPPTAVRKLNRKAGIRVMGEVNDIRPYLVQADVSVAPLRLARGIQNKILEAMAMGVPVVATPEAVEGIEVENQKEILIAGSPEAFAREVVRLLSDRKLHGRISRGARDMVVQRYDWKTIGDQLESLIAEPALTQGIR